MAITKKVNPNARRNNSFVAKKHYGLEEGVEPYSPTLEDYSVTVDITSLTAAQIVSIDGVEYDYGEPISLGTVNGRKRFKEFIEDSIQKAGYDIKGGIDDPTLATNDLTFTVRQCEAVMNYIEAAGNAFTTS